MGRFAIVALLVCARGAYAEAVHPAPHWIAGRLDGITAKLVVRYHLAAVGPSGDNGFQLDLPDNSVVTGAVVLVDGVKRRLAFDTAKKGRARLDEVLTTPAGAHRRWAVLVSAEYNLITKVDIAAPHAAMLTIDLEVEAPTCFSQGTRYASVSPDWRASIDRELRTVVAIPAGCVAPPNDEGSTAQPRTWLAFPGDDGRWRASGDERVVVRGERVDVEHGHFARVELNLASELADVPADLHTVFVVDASRSMRGDELETQTKIIESYVEHAPNTQIQIVAFARKAHALLPAWTRAADAKLSGLATLASANGSNVDTALIEAVAWLARTDGTRRIVLFGDERLGRRVAALDGSVLRGLVPANTLVHVIALDPPPPAPPERKTPDRTALAPIIRADDIAFAQLARDTEGLAARATLVDGHVDATMLVRPIALEQVSVTAPGWTVDQQLQANEPRCTGDLAQGTACAWFGVADAKAAVAQTVAVDGLLWNHRVHRTLTPDPGRRELLARMLTGFTSNVGEAEHDLEVVAHAVNGAWSLYGEWGAPAGYADQDIVGIENSGCGCDEGGLVGGLFGTHGSGVASQRRSIAAQLEHVVAECHVDARVDISLELTDHEIVDVAVTAPRAELRDCVTEAVWNTLLFVPNPQPHAFETVSLGA